MDDAWEITYFGIPPGTVLADFDNDGLTDLQEFQNTTLPNNPDSDGDGYFDGEEVAAGTNPNAPGEHPVLTPGTYYVDNSVDGPGSGTEANPWKWLYYAIHHINDGSPGSYVLNVAAGTYDEAHGEVPILPSVGGHPGQSNDSRN